MKKSGAYNSFRFAKKTTAEYGTMSREYKDFELEQSDEGNAFTGVLPSVVSIK